MLLKLNNEFDFFLKKVLHMDPTYKTTLQYNSFNSYHA